MRVRIYAKITRIKKDEYNKNYFQVEVDGHEFNLCRL